MHNFFISFLKSFTNFSLYFLQIPKISTFIAVKKNSSNLFPELFSFSIELSNPTTKHLYFYLGLSYKQKVLQMKSFLSFLFFSHKDLLTAWDFTLHLTKSIKFNKWNWTATNSSWQVNITCFVYYTISTEVYYCEAFGKII